MARIKYSEEQEPIKKKHFGFTFIKSAFGETMMTGQRNRTPRTSRQLSRMQPLQKSIRFWRTMPGTVKESWETFAATYPQPAKRSGQPALSGFQLFIKRNYYCFLNSGIETDFLLYPELVSLPISTPVFTLQAGSNTIDLTEAYISNFGFIPSPGQWLKFHAIPYSEISGQFFPAINSTLQVLETYLDGFFLNIEMPVCYPSIVYSVYLSKPVNPGSYYKSSKSKFMGCFTTKSFLGLSDTPSSYAGQAGKVATVNPEETGLVFSAGGSGGLTCSDLPSCPTIISINQSISDIQNLFLYPDVLSVPSIKNGYLYNDALARNPLLSSSSEWFNLPYSFYLSWLQSFVSITYAGVAFKESGLTYWNSPNANSVNYSKMSFRGSGIRNSTGSFSSIKSSCSFWFPYTPVSSSHPLPSYSSSSNSTTNSNFSTKTGASVRLCRLNPTSPNGSFGQYVGNNGTVYKTVVFNGIEWLMVNLAETLFRDGSPLPYITTDAAWAADTIGGYCAYNNDLANV